MYENTSVYLTVLLSCLIPCERVQPWRHAWSQGKNAVGIKNIARGVGLAVFATFVGCALAFTVPDAIAAQFSKTLPYWFYESEVSNPCTYPLLTVPKIWSHAWRKSNWSTNKSCLIFADDADQHWHSRRQLHRHRTLQIGSLQF